MKCKDIEQWIYESSPENLDVELRDTVFQHLQNCSRCARLKEDMDGIRKLLQQRACPNLPEELDRSTYLKCRDEIHSLQDDKKKIGLGQHIQTIPVSMKIAFIALLVLTAVWILPIFEDFGFGGESVSFSTILGLFWIIQNVVMLLFAPLLIRRYQSKKEQQTNFSTGG